MTEGMDKERAVAEQEERNKSLRLALLRLCASRYSLGVEYLLIEGGEPELARRLALIGVANAVAKIRKETETFLQTVGTSNDKRRTVEILQDVLHDPVHRVYAAAEQDLDYSCKPALVRFLMSVYEAGETYPGVENMARVIGDEEKENEAIEKGKVSGNHMRPSVDQIPLLITACENFMRDIEGDPILNVDYNAQMDEWLIELKEKTGFGGMDDKTVLEKLRSK